VLVGAVMAALLSTALAGVIPAWRASRADLQDVLRDGGKGSGGGFARVAKTLVVAEIALTMLLLVGAGTFIRALDGLLTQPVVGASHALHVLTAKVALPPQTYADDGQRIRFLENVAERLRQQPGVLAASAANTVPGAALGSHENIAAQGQPRPAAGWQRAQMGMVDGHFLETYGVRLTAGRFFTVRDRADSDPVTVIDPATAVALWPGRDPLGQQLVLYPGKSWAMTLTVIGVIEPLQLDGMLQKPLPGMLVPLAQARGQSPLHNVGLALRVHGDAEAFAPRLVDLVRSVDTQVAVYGVGSQARDMARGRIGMMVLTQVFSALGLVALLLAAAGLYGVLAFSVAQRTREIGIRRAIGAGHTAIVREVGRQLLWQLGLGLGIGSLLAWPWSALLADPGMRTQAHDLHVFVPVLLMVLCVAVLSALLPLYRALRVDPAIALRYE
ncbi:MAG: FtsX-like permease family protein, partial [Rhodanobacter sp.]